MVTITALNSFSIPYLKFPVSGSLDILRLVTGDSAEFYFDNAYTVLIRGPFDHTSYADVITGLEFLNGIGDSVIRFEGLSVDEMNRSSLSGSDNMFILNSLLGKADMFRLGSRPIDFRLLA